MTIATNILRVRETIAEACDRAGRDPSAVTLIAVSKTHPPETVLEAVAAGVQHFGENRVEEAGTKIPAVNGLTPRPLVWHMIGHIQSRKAKDVLPLFQYVQSVDSVKLAGKLSGLAVTQGCTLDVLLEVNVSGEEAKYGLVASGWQTDVDTRRRLWADMEAILALPGLNVRGLMTMAPIVDDMEQARPVFASLAALRNALAEAFHRPLPDLSMGMTDDYPVAVEEGATMVRVGRAIFGERQS
ncbi:MAG: YggS family pyridoxal phosphate-dependent enzyme [Chloroflexi bacterium]|nr:YggS family pyridoxal phosphate-dependent enzyme [Chloroflexota bacterium]